MHCFMLPKWVIARIDRARRAFLWGNGQRSRYLSLCNWVLTSTPKQWGGMGISDLHVRNVCLLLRWWWKGYTDSDSIWTLYICIIRWQGFYVHGPRIWSIRGSFFWTQLHSIKHLFTWSTTWQIGDGTEISYWYDDWGEGAIATTGSRQQRRSLSLREATELENWQENHTVQFNFNNEGDMFIWNWESNGRYSSKSVYGMIKGEGRMQWELQHSSNGKDFYLPFSAE